MSFKIVALWTDVVLWLLMAALVLYVWRIRSSPNLRASWTKVFADPAAMSAAVVLGGFLAVTMLDSVHFRLTLPPSAGAAAGTPGAYDVRTQSLLDMLLQPLIDGREATYSLPLATHSFTKESAQDGTPGARVFPRLAHAGVHLREPHAGWLPDVLLRAGLGLLGGVASAALVALAAAMLYARRHALPLRDALLRINRNDTALPMRAGLLTVAAVAAIVGPTIALGSAYHVLGTDRTGNDVLYQALKSVRTAFVIGGLATLATLPFAVTLGIAAGYFKGWVDEVIQYLYTTLSSVPNVLLIAACVLMVQVFIDQNPDVFATSAERSDVRLFLLCVILGVTGWAGLARLLRGETLKLREFEYVQAATAFGVGHWRIMARHVFPNVAHLALITTVLEFSSLILYEAVLSYVGVGVDPSMNSFGGMINLARSEMSRDPVVWWSFAAAFGFMVTLVLAANLFADGVRDAFDPRSRSFRAARVAGRKAMS